MIFRSSWNHYEGQIETDAGVGRSAFQYFAQNQLQKWADIIFDWVLLSPNLLVIHYELLKEDQERELRKIVKFLGIEKNDERFKCMEFENQRFKSFKRYKKELKKNPYNKVVNGNIQTLIKITQKFLVEHKHEPLPLHLYPYQE